MYAENLYGQWVCTHSPNGAGSARWWTVQQHTVWREERGVAARAGTDRPCCLLPAACLKTNSTYGVDLGEQARQAATRGRDP